MADAALACDSPRRVNRQVTAQTVSSGLPPAAGECMRDGEQVEVPYEADCVFWKATA